MTAWLRADAALSEADEMRERALEEQREARRRVLRKQPPRKVAPEIVGPLDPYRLTPQERFSYRTGTWIGRAVQSKELKDEVTDEQAAAELAARVRLMLEER